MSGSELRLDEVVLTAAGLDGAELRDEGLALLAKAGAVCVQPVAVEPAPPPPAACRCRLA
mgnify:CR=1 FL=1